VLTVGRIVETEAYCGETDKACHAHFNRRTHRTAVMFGPPGVAYVYLCYGIHHLFNIVTNQEGKADAVLVRAIEPVEGLPEMQGRRGLAGYNYRLTAGPGSMSQALGISTRYNGHDLTAGEAIWLEDRGDFLPAEAIETGPRVGVAYAGEDALLPWRFSIRHNPWRSKAKGGV
jgi:DNA-3-methyladenine glycosylase